MKSSEALLTENVERLRADLEAHGRSAPPPTAQAVARGIESRSEPLKAAAKRRLKRAGTKVLGWLVREEAQRICDVAIDARVEHIDGMLAGLRAKLDATPEPEEMTSLVVNAELIKAELRLLQERLATLGRAIAPASGLEGAPAQMAVLRERIQVVDRRLRTLVAGGDFTPDSAGARPDEETPPPLPAEQPGVPFDYVGFERRFRGDPDNLRNVIRHRYLGLLSTHAPVVDVGCGTGELLEILRDESIPAVGVELDPEMAGIARDKGLDIVTGDAIAWLAEQPDASLGAIISLHVIEHLPLQALLDFVALASRKLVPGGAFVAETPNPASLVVLGNSYVLDPTHEWPVHPSLMAFLLEDTGFRTIEFHYYSPADAYRLEPVPTSEAPALGTAVNTAFEKLNESLYGPQEYAIVATTTPEEDSDA